MGDRTDSVLSRDPTSRHILALALLALVTLVRWSRWLLAETPLFDEGIYLEAFRAVASGASPYSVDGYYYPPLCAVIGAQLLEVLGQSLVSTALRLLVVFGLVSTTWWSLIWSPLSYSWRLLVGSVFLCVAPAVGLGLRTGNLSFLVVGMIVAGLTYWHRRPVACGFLLGSSVAIKPVAPVAVAVLVAHRAISNPSRKWTAGLVACAFMAGALYPPDLFRQMLTLDVAPLSYHRSFSLARLAQLVGLDVQPVVIVAGVALIAMAISRLRTLTHTETLCVAATGAVASLPIIWPHTLLLTLPVQVLAVSRALERRSRAAAGGRWIESQARGMRFEMWMVAVAVAAIQFAEGAGSVDRMASWIQLIALGVPYLAPIFLTSYLLTTADRNGRGQPFSSREGG